MTIDESFTKNEKDRMFLNAENLLMQTGGFEILEREKLSNIQIEREKQKDERYTDASIAEQGKALGTDYLFLINMSDYSFPKLSMRPTATCQMDLKVVEVATGKIKNTLSQKIKYMDDKPFSKQQGRINVVNHSAYWVNKFIWKSEKSFSCN